MNITAVVYLPEGRILRVLQLPEDSLQMNLAPGELYLLVAEEIPPDDYYVENGELKPIQSFPEISVRWFRLNDLYQIVLNGIPKHTGCLWPDGYRSIETDGNVVCDVDYPGSYTFHLRHVHYGNKEITVNVTP